MLVDFGMDRPRDCVDEFAIIGLRRDLEGRWRFFLSGAGVGGP